MILIMFVPYNQLNYHGLYQPVCKIAKSPVAYSWYAASYTVFEKYRNTLLKFAGFNPVQSAPDICSPKVYFSFEEHSGYFFKICSVVRNKKLVIHLSSLIQKIIFFKGFSQGFGDNSCRINDLNIEVKNFADLVPDYRVMRAAKDQGLYPVKRWI